MLDLAQIASCLKKIMNVSNTEEHIYIYTPKQIFMHRAVFNPTSSREV